MSDASAMTPRHRDVLAEFARSVRAVIPDARIWGFGSRARGTAGPDADFDICVVIPAINPAVRESVYHAAWEVGFNQPDCMVLSPILLTRESFEDGPMAASALVANILREHPSRGRCGVTDSERIAALVV